MQFTARFPGRCTATGSRINPGDVITGSRGRYRLVSRASSPDVNPDAALASSIDPELAADDPDTAAHAGRYLRRSLESGVSHIWNSGGREFYRNRRGLCEDAPCCGCCNA